LWSGGKILTGGGEGQGNDTVSKKFYLIRHQLLRQDCPHLRMQKKTGQYEGWFKVELFASRPLPMRPNKIPKRKYPVIIEYLPSSKDKAPAKTRAAYSPTLKPAVAIQFSISWNKTKMHQYDMDP
jgi:hypothetical protein